MIIQESMDNIAYAQLYKKLKETIEKYGLIINENKTVVMTNNKELKDTCQVLYIKSTNAERYLGANLRLEQNIIEGDKSSYFDSMVSKKKFIPDK